LRRTYWNSREIGKFDPVDKDNSIFEEENSKLHV